MQRSGEKCATTRRAAATIVQKDAAQRRKFRNICRTALKNSENLGKLAAQLQTNSKKHAAQRRKIRETCCAAAKNEEQQAAKLGTLGRTVVGILTACGS